MFQGMNPRQMQRMMEQMGVKTQEIKAERVIIEKEGSQIIITDPQIIETSMKGQRSFNISGNIEEKAITKEDDLKLVMEKTGASREKAGQALAESNGDIAGAIMKLQEAKE